MLLSELWEPDQRLSAQTKLLSAHLGSSRAGPGRGACFSYSMTVTRYEGNFGYVPRQPRDTRYQHMSRVPLG